MLRISGRQLRLSVLSVQVVTQQCHHRFFFSSTPEAGGGDKPSDSTVEQAPADDEIVKLTKENKELKEKLLRSYAEEENVRRIAKRDVENAKTYANTSFAKSLLDVADNLERAMGAVPPESAASSDPVIKNLLVGVKMTNNELTKVFEKFGVFRYGAVGDKFDPTMHEALFQIPDACRPAGTIGEVLKAGYKLKDRVIRAAEVGAVVAPAAPTNESDNSS